MILKRSRKAGDFVTGRQDTVGLRVPAHPVAHAMLAAFGGGVAAPSANRFGLVSPTTAAHVREDLGRDVELVLDGGPSEVGIESTIVDLRGPQPVLLRPGVISAAMLEAVLGVRRSLRNRRIRRATRAASSATTRPRLRHSSFPPTSSTSRSRG